MFNLVEERPDVTRRGFVFNYPDFRHWRGAAVEEGLSAKPLNVYLHLPYCVQRCAYCLYKTTTLQKTQLAAIDRYVGSLCREIEIVSQHFQLGARPTLSVYFGGGTPSLLSAENIGRIMETLQQNLTLAAPEISFEAEPVTLTRQKAEILARHGVNRISVGVQSFAEEVVFRTGRRDTEKRALEAIDTALATGAVVNIDLISGLEGETPETWAYTVKRAIETGAHSITVYKLEVYANTEYFAALKQHRISLPSDSEELALARFAVDEFTRADYRPFTFFTFTRGGGYAQRHVANKWQGMDYYGFGASAFGALGNWAYQNTIELDRYSDVVERGELPVFRGYVCNSLEVMTRDVILGMKLVSLDRRAFKRRHGVDLVRLCAPVVQQLSEDGFITVDDDAVTLSHKGILYGDHVGRTLAASLEQLAS